MFGLFKKFDVNLCPEVKGQILLEGKPVAGIKITRSLGFMDEKKRVDCVSTDADGRFLLEEINIRSRKPGSMFGVEFTLQKITASFKDKEYKLWLSPYYGIEKSPDYAQKLASLVCELKSKPAKFEFPNSKKTNRDHYATSICRWDDDYNLFEEFDRVS
ncbi:hypothetical protein EZV61_11070 [Corallincola luteus]|uniref:DUF6795 domain-containing protein n=1 Tax=Corallincola luteus TaxID=1775177 RepID=A0ABY2AKM7_9GAMM|nr:DUF6795 domain-containing protein [Corallincola luteus]TCI03402.1 hypothetical protein EZV61_11070 [Corallincola luteus]